MVLINNCGNNNNNIIGAIILLTIIIIVSKHSAYEGKRQLVVDDLGDRGADSVDGIGSITPEQTHTHTRKHTHTRMHTGSESAWLPKIAPLECSLHLQTQSLHSEHVAQPLEAMINIPTSDGVRLWYT